LGNVRAHVFVSGMVQGVFFRQKTRQLAIGLNVTGWVRNLGDGRVEAVFEGEEEAVAAIVDFCGKGPKGAKVDHVQLNWEDFRGEFQNFTIAF
jgi:acylphosphatase